MTPEFPELAKAVPVSTGWTWTTTFMAINAAVLSAIGIWLKTRPGMFKTKKDAEEKLRDDLIARVDKLEQLQATKDAQQEAVLAVMRHRLNNVTACLDALLMLIEQDPTKAAEAAARIREMRARQNEAESAEKATVAAATIAATIKNSDPT